MEQNIARITINLRGHIKSRIIKPPFTKKILLKIFKELMDEFNPNK